MRCVGPGKPVHEGNTQDLFPILEGRQSVGETTQRLCLGRPDADNGTVGNRRDRVCVFINFDMEAVGNWAERRNLPYAGYVDLASRDEVYGLVQECIEKVNLDLAQDAELANSQIHRFLILHKELDADDGELTRSRKVRRGHIGEKYGALVGALYDGKSSIHVDAQVKYEDGRTGTISADLKIRDAKTFPAAAGRKAA